jgi:hypothetical protein
VARGITRVGVDVVLYGYDYVIFLTHPSIIGHVKRRLPKMDVRSEERLTDTYDFLIASQLSFHTSNVL